MSSRWKTRERWSPSHKAIGWLFVLCLFLCPAPGLAAEQVVKVGTFSFKPAVFRAADGTTRGFFVDLLSEVAKQEGWKVEYVHGSWAEGLERIQTGEVDVLTSVALTPERTAFMDYGEEPLLQVWSEVYIAEASKFESVLDLEGARVAVMRGDFNRAVIEKTMTGFGITCDYLEFSDFQEVLAAVEEGQADAGIVNNTFGTAHAGSHSVESTGLVFSPFPIYFAVARGRNAELLEVLDAHLKVWKSDNRSIYHQGLHEWLRRDVQVERVVPPAVINALAALGVVSLVFFLFSMILRRRVRSGTISLRASEEQREESERMLSAVLVNLPGAVYRCLNDPEWKMEYLSDGVTALTGYPPEAFIGSREITLSSLVHEDDKQEVRERVREAVDAGRSFELEYRIRTRSGELRSFWEQGIGVSNARGEVVHLVGVILDVTDRTRVEEEKEKIRAQLLQSQKMESVGRLAGGVAHDYNNMLGVIIGHTELALMNTDDAEVVQEHLEEINRAALRSGDLTHQLLAYSRKQPVAPRHFDLVSQVTETLRLVGRLMKEDIELVWEPGGVQASVIMDPTQFDQVLTNLCVNAGDAILGTGKITVEVTRLDLGSEELEERPGVEAGPFVRLTVSDTGQGMDEEVLAKVFEPFFTTKEVGRGTGLGLATVASIVEQNGGFIGVETVSGEGSSFSIHVPRVETSEAPETEVPAAPAPVLERATILLVEDNASVLATAQAMLEKLGHRVLTATTAADAIELASSDSVTIDLLLTDIVMPEMNGLQLSERVLEEQPGARRAFISGYTADILSRQGAIDPEVKLLMKPFTFTRLSEFLVEVLSAS